VLNSSANTLLSLRPTGTEATAEATLPQTTPGRVQLLTRRLAAGDEEAFREFHAQYFTRLHRFLLVVARGNDQEAQDALQETLLSVVRYAREFADEETFWCWLKVVARSAARDGGRKRRRYFALLERFALGRSEDVHSAQPSEDDALRSALADVLDELAPDDRQLVEGKYLEGATVKELSATIGSTDKAVESRLLRLRRLLRERLLNKLEKP